MSIYSTHTIIILLIVIACLLVYVYDLRRHLKLLDDIVKRLRLQERVQLSKLEAKGADRLTADEKRFVDICHYMDDKKPFLNPKMNADDLAAALGTNRTYVSNCIRKFTDGRLSVFQFIIRYRLRYATQLMRSRPEMSLSEVATSSGFYSRSAFNRQFAQFYGCSPTEYKERKRE